jgi:gliding motility-associated-like protein
MDRPIYGIGILYIVVLYLAGFSAISLSAQSWDPDWFTCDNVNVTNCNPAVPSLFVDLRSDPNDMWYSCLINRGSMIDTCCGFPQTDNNDRCIEFKVLMHPDADAIMFEIPDASDPLWQSHKNHPNAPGSPGAKPSGSLEYRINCGGSTYLPQQVACLTQSQLNDTIYITFCKPGTNANVYRIRSIRASLDPDIEVLAEGCGNSVTVSATDIDVSTVTWNSTQNPAYNAYLSATCCDTTVTVTVPKGAPLPPGNPPVLVYQMCAYPVGAGSCPSLTQICTTVNVVVLSPPTVMVSAPVVCPGGPYYAEVTNQGSSVLQYTWYEGWNGTGAAHPTGNTDNYYYATPGNKSVVVVDPTITTFGYDECAYDTVNFTINTHPVPLAQINGPTDVCRNVNYLFTATNDGIGVDYQWNFGSGAVPATYNGSNNAGRNPPAVRYTTCGNKTITLIVISVNGCRDTTTYNVIGDATPPVLCSLPNPQVECGGTANNNAAILAWHNNNLATLASCAVDNCPLFVYSNFNPANFTPDNTCGASTTAGSLTVQYRVTDSCQSTTINATFTIVDDTPPVVTDPDLNDMSFECVGEIPPPLTDFDVNEVCGNVSIVWDGDSPSGNPCNLQIQRTYRVTDACGNVTTFVQTFTINDISDPTISCPGQVNLEGCDVTILASTAALGNLAFSLSNQSITAAQFQAIGGNVSDNCGIASLYYYDSRAGFCPIVVTRTFVVQDSCGNSDNCQQIITINDTTDPVIQCPATQNIEGCDAGILATSPQVGSLQYSTTIRVISLAQLQAAGGNASDNCRIDSIYYFDSQTSTCPVVVTRTFVVVDSCGNRDQCQQTINIDDTTPPAITCPPAITLELCGVYDLGSSPLVGGLEYSESPRSINLSDLQGLGGNVTDACGIDSIYYYDTQSSACPITVIRTFVAIDLCGNPNMCTQVITIDDTTNPTLTCPANLNLESCGIYNLGALPQTGNLEYSEDPRTITLAQLQAIGGNAGDNCGIDSLYYFDSQTGSCPIVVTRTYVVVDSCGNRVQCLQTIEIDDTTLPTISCPGNIILEACSEADLEFSAQVGNLEYSEVPRLITVADLQGVGGNAGDNCGIDSLYYVDSRIGECPLIITRVFTVIDSCGNRASCSQEVRINDTTNPVLTCPPSEDIEACDVDDLVNAAVLGNLGYSETPTSITIAQLQAANGDVTDNCGIDTLYYYDSQTGFCPIVITRTFVAIDSCGNQVQCTQTIRIFDTTDPVITCPGPVTIEGCDVSILATSPQVSNLEYSSTARFIDIATLVGLGGSASDVCGIDSLYYFDVQDFTCPIVVTRTFVAVDSCGNRAECTQEIEIDDTTLPTIQCPADVVLEACGVYDLATSSQVGNLGYSEDIRIITLADIQGLGGDAADECGIDSIYYYDVQSGSCPIIVTRTFVVVDLCGNRTECPQEIQIDDTTAPSLTCPGPVVIEACGVYDLANSAAVGNLEYSEAPREITLAELLGIGGNASDACGLDSLYYFDVQDGRCPIIVTRTFVAVDSCLNRTTCTQEIQIDDTTDPVLTCPGSAIVEGCGTGDLLSAPEVGNLEFSATPRIITIEELQGTGGDVTDNCGLDSLYYFDSELGTCPITVTRTFVAIDSCGNRVQCTQTVTIDDTTDPVLSCPADVVIEGCDESFLVGSPLVGNLEYSETIRPITVTEIQAGGGDASDNCFIDSLYYYDSQTGFCPTVITRTFVAVDSCGNRVSCLQEIQVYDSTLPTISCPPAVTIDGCSVNDLATSTAVGNLEYSAGIRSITLAEFQGAGGNAGDNCGIDSLYYYDIQNSICPIEITRTFVVIDSCGNQVECTQEITIQDVTLPTLLCPVDQVIEGCGVYDLATSAQVGNLEYSEDIRIITLADLQGLGGDAGDNCGIDSIYYYDTQTGSCPIIVTRTFVVVDSCGSRVSCPQEIQIDDTTEPTLTCPGGVVLEACGVYDLENSAAVGFLEYSETPRIITLAELQGLGGDAGDACGLDSLYYFDVQDGSCPIIVTRTFVATDSCHNRVTCTQEIQIDDTTDPVLTCPGVATIEGCGTADLLNAPEVGNLEYSESIRIITLEELQGTGGDVSDNCGIDSLYYFDSQDGSCPITVIRTFVAIDSCGNLVQCTQTVTIDDTTDPTLDCPSDVVIEGCDESILAGSAQVGNLEYSEEIRPITVAEIQAAGGDAGDNCFIDSLYYYDSQTDFCPTVITRTFVVVDSCGNRVSCLQEIQIHDTTLPTISCPAAVTIDGCSVNDLATSPAVGNLEYSTGIRSITLAEFQGAGGNAGDNCGIDSLYYYDIQNSICPIEITRTFVVIDSCGNQVECTQEITIQDVTLPTLLCPVDQVIEGCGVYDLATSAQVGNLEYSEDIRIITLADLQGLGGDAGDNCGIDSIYYYDTQNGSCPIIVTRTFVVVDSCGSRVSCPQEIQIDDTTEPTLTCPGGVVLEACGVYDLANSAAVGFLEYSEAPRIITLAELQAIGGDAGDACGLDSLYYFDVQDGSCPIIVTRTFVATDSCHNRVTCTQEIQIDDTTDPVLTCPASVDVEGCGTDDLQSLSEVGSLEYSEAIRPVTLAEIQSIGGDVSDNCGIDSLYYFDTQSGSCPIVVTRTFVAVDSCGNRVLCEQTVRINDTTSPSLTCPDDVEIEGCDIGILVSSSQAGNLEYSETIRPITLVELQAAGGDAGDNCFIDSLYYFDRQTGFCPITVTRTFVAVDSCGNRVQCPQEIRIHDSTDPSLTCPADVTIDGCDVSALAGSDVVGNLPFSTVQTAITLDQLQAAGGNAGDNCGIETIVYIDAQVGQCPIEILRTFIVTDTCGNWVSCEYEITIDNTTQPSIVCPADITVQACALDDLLGLTSLEFSSIERTISKAAFDALDDISLADDICGIREVGYIDEVVQQNCPVIVRRTFTVYDSCGLTAACAQMIQLDPIPIIDPVCPDPEVVASCLTQTEVDQLFANWISQFAYNGSGCNLVITPLDTSTAPPFCGGVRNIVFVVTDQCGNQTSCTSSFTVPVAPELTMSCPPDISVQCPSEVPPPFGTVAQFLDAGGSFSSTCGLVPNSFGLVEETSDGNTCPEIITRIYEAEDICGHIRQCIQTIRINDTIAPVLIGVPEDLTVACDDVPDPPVIGTGISVQDNCDLILPEFSEEIIPGLCENIYEIVRTWTATDACGNSVEAQQRITVTDCRPDVRISINPNPVCLGGSVTFDAVIRNNYTNPVYRWQFLWNGTWIDLPGGNVIPYVRNNVDLSDAGLYRLLVADRLQNITNFDCNALSDEAELVVTRPARTDLVASICDGDTYTVGSSSYTTSGMYQDILIGSNGCDSIVSLDLTVISNTEGSLDTTICRGERILIGGTSLNRDGQFVVHLPNAAGCDSTVTVRLRIQDPSFTTIRDTICEGSSVTIAGEVYTEGGNYSWVLQDRYGCDSTLEISIHEIPTSNTVLDVAICTGDSYTLAGQTFSTTGTYNIPLQSQVTGCDSIVTLNLLVQDQINRMLDVTICVGDSFQMGDQYYHTAGIYRDTVISRAGCDSIITLDLKVVTSFVTNLDITLCEGESFTVGANVYTETGSYTDLLVSRSGCDSTVNLNLVVNPHHDTLITADVCEGESLIAGGERFTETGVYTVVIPTALGCDSTIRVELTVHEAYDTLYDIELCEGEVFSLGGQTYSQSGSYEQTYTSIFGCDSIIYIDIQVYDRYEETLDITLCTGSSYQVGTNIYNTTGNYSDTLISNHGCDSIIHLNLLVVDDIMVDLQAQICEGDSYQLGNTSYNVTGIYTETFVSRAGCDSIVTLDLNVLDVLRDTTIATICAGEIYDFDGTLLNVAGSYNKNYSSVAGCDSIHTLDLSVVPVSRVNLFEEICEGETFTLGSQTFTEAGTFIDTLTSVDGCDSIVTLNLRVNAARSTVLNRQICEGETFDLNGVLLDSTGTYTDTLNTLDGCDSIVTLNLTVNPVYNVEIDAQICEGQVYTFAGQALSSTGQYTGNFQTTRGCDSLVTLNLTVVTVLRDTTLATLCGGEVYDFDGTSINTGGTYNKNYTSATGCDSVHTLILTVMPVERVNISDEICAGDTLFVGDIPYTETGIFIDTLTTNSGCDSIVTINLRVNEAKTTRLNRQICEGEVFDFNGLTLDSTGIYTASLPTTDGCDSIVILDLQVNPVYEQEMEAMICVGQIYAFNGQTLNESGQYTASLKTKTGCDSIVVLNLQVVDVLFTDLTATICNGDTYDFFGTTINRAGTYNHTLPSTAGCDSVINLTLEVVDQINTRLTAILCEGETYSFGSTVLSESGTYRDTLTSQSGCDSIVELQLIVSPVYETTINAQICRGSTYSFMGQDLSESGIYVDSLITASGCDSIITLNLQVDDIKKDTVMVTLCQGESISFAGNSYNTTGIYEEVVGGVECDTLKVLILTVLDEISVSLTQQICTGSSVTFDGKELSTSGTYSAIFTSSAGCDSTVSLVLEVVDAIHNELEYFICAGDSVEINDAYYYSEGEFTDTLISSGGCDSILHISIGQATARFDTIDIAICEGSSYRFGGIEYTETVSVSDTFPSASGCDSIVTLNLVVQPVFEEDLEVTICTGTSYTHDGKSYAEAGTYTLTYQTTEGCDSIVNLIITVNDQIVNEFTVQNCLGGTYDFNGQTITEAGTYQETFTSINGCDSIVILHYELDDVIETFATSTICQGDSVMINGIYYFEDTIVSDTSTSIMGCDSIAYHTVVVISNVSLEGTDAVICEGESVELQVSLTGTPGSQLVWTPATGLSCADCLNPVASPESTTTYKVSTTGCLGTNIETEVTVEVVPLPRLVLAQEASPNGGQEVTLSATTIDPSHAISWYNSSGELICANCPTIVQQISGETTFVAIATNSLGCETQEEITVDLTREEEDCDVGLIVASNALTPNGDGSNDYFQIVNTGDSEITLVQVFNRWGEIVFESHSEGLLWDGTFRGVDVNPGVFVYMIHGICTSGETFILSGNVTVIR